MAQSEKQFQIQKKSKIQIIPKIQKKISRRRQILQQ